MTRVQQLLISAKHLALWATSNSERHAARNDAQTFNEAVAIADFADGVRESMTAITSLMQGIAEVRDPEAYAALRGGLSLVVDGVRLELAALARERAPPPRPYYIEKS